MSPAAKQALVCWFAAFALVITALFAFLGPPATADGAGEAIGRVLTHTGFAALIGWYLARRANPAWSWRRFVLVYVTLILALAVVTTAGRVQARETGVCAVVSATLRNAVS